MRIREPQVPGIEAASKIAIAFGVSLDWLLLSQRASSQRTHNTQLGVTRAACFFVFDRMTEDSDSGADIVGNGKILGYTPEKLSAEITTDAAERASALLDNGGAFNAVEIGVKALQNS